MFAYPEFDSEGKKVLSTAESEMMMDIVTYKMKKGDKKSFCLDKDELALMLVLGAVTFEYEGKKVSAKRGYFILYQCQYIIYLKFGQVFRHSF